MLVFVMIYSLTVYRTWTWFPHGIGCVHFILLTTSFQPAYGYTLCVPKPVMPFTALLSREVLHWFYSLAVLIPQVYQSRWNKVWTVLWSTVFCLLSVVNELVVSLLSVMGSFLSSVNYGIRNTVPVNRLPSVAWIKTIVEGLLSPSGT